MIREIENRRSIRKYKPDEIERKLIEEIIYSASLAPSAKNRQPWKFIVYQGKERLMNLCRNGHLPYRMLRIQSGSCRRSHAL